MEKGLRPIPALYACYLLRSTVRHASLYVGSTPDPPRRLRQHNGETVGGAARTSRDSLRPWEMTCLVTGFPSKIAALQFEWAWQNSHLTRHITAESRITVAKANTRVSAKTGRIRRRVARPRLSLNDRLANLQLLLQSKSFCGWPLQVTFFAKDIHRAWSRWIERSELQLDRHIRVGSPSAAGLHAGVASSIDAESGDTMPEVPNVTTDYLRFKSVIEKRQKMFQTESSDCALCRRIVARDGAGAMLCHSDTCNMVAHIDCLATHLTSQSSSLLPTSGHCPQCRSEMRWLDVTTELTLHMRGIAEVTKLMKPRGRGKAKITEIGPEHDDVALETLLHLQESDVEDAIRELESDTALDETSAEDASLEEETSTNPAVHSRNSWIAISSDNFEHG